VLVTCFWNRKLMTKFGRALGAISVVLLIALRKCRGFVPDAIAYILLGVSV